jgi:hypothetical protein
MRIKEMPNWPPKWLGSDPPSATDLVGGTLRHPERIQSGVRWTIAIGPRTGKIELKILSPPLLERLWPIFLQMGGHSLASLGEQNIPERQASPSVREPVSKRTGTTFSAMDSPVTPRPRRKYSEYGSYNAEGHGDGNVG